MSKITDITVDHFQIPLAVTLTDATHGEMKQFDLITVRITDADGVMGLGYTYSLVGGSSIRTLATDSLAPLLLQEEGNRIESLWQKMWWFLHYIGRGGPVSFAMAAIDIALWDLKARKQQTPLWQLLGGHDPKVKTYAGGIDLYFTLDELLAQTEKNLEKGFRAIKMKVGRDNLSEDLERVSAMRNFLGDDFPLMVDANMGWTVDQAIRAGNSLREYNVVWLEEPTIPDDFEGYARIQKEGGLAIAAGENFHTLYEFRHLIAVNGVAFPEPDVATCGGITVWMKVAHLAESNNLPVTSHGVHDLHLQLLAAVPNKSYLEVHGFGLEKYIRNPLQVIDGYATAPNEVGHGVDFHWDDLGQFAI